MNRKTTAFILLAFLALGCKFGAAEQQQTLVSNTAAQANSQPVSANLAGGADAVPTPALAAKPNAVCPDPSKPCHHKEKRFDGWELSFKMPAKLADNKTNLSAPFYAVLLDTYPLTEDCDGGEFIESIEAERKDLQSDHPERKVFAAYECPNMAAVGYEFDGKRDAAKETVLIGNFLAVYAGETKEEANELLNKLKSRYPKAVVKRMTASYEKIEQ